MVQRPAQERVEASTHRIVIGLAADLEHRAEVRAVIRSFGQLARASGREWLIRKTLTRTQVHLLLKQSLLAIVRDVLPHTLRRVTCE